MRFAITALGSAGGRTVDQVVGDIVRYLEPRSPDGPGRVAVESSVPSGDGPSTYYADRGSEPGRWLGVGAFEAGLTGQVAAEDFAGVLAGRDPRTGSRLITAAGSSARRPSLGVGQHTAVADRGDAVYDLGDAAAALGLEARDLRALTDAGETRAVAALASWLAGAPLPPTPEGSYLVPAIDTAGVRWISERELTRCDTARNVGTAPQLIAAIGAPDDQLTVAEAARLAGVTSRYVRRLCHRGEDHREPIAGDPTRHVGRTRNFILAHRGTRQQWIITRRELTAFLERRHVPAVRVGFDLTLTTEKSLGVLALLGDDRTRIAVLDAIERGNDHGLAYLEYHATVGRSRGTQVLGRGLTIASFRHLTSRALDPFPHHHNVIANSIIDEHGTRRALDARHLYDHAQAASALATLHMRHHLRESLGVRWRVGRTGTWEIDGIGDDVLREFSHRRIEIDAAVAELEVEIGRRTTLAEVHAVITETRPPKTDVDTTALVNGWWRRARRLGLSPEDLARCTNQPLRARRIDEPELFARLASPTEGVCARHSVFTRSDVLLWLAAADLDGQPLPIDADHAERLTDTFLATDLVVELDTSGETGSLNRTGTYTTAEILGVQQRILDQYRAGLGQHAAVVPNEVIDEALQAQPMLTDEQRSLVANFCSAGHRVQCAIGRAGAGKTTTMRTAAAAWTRAGYEVVGAAVKGEATRHLAHGATIPAETVAWYLARTHHPPLHERTVLIVDEASTLSDRDLAALLHLAERTGAAVRLIGDPDQHGAVAAGGMFRHLCNTHPDQTPELATPHRVQHHADQRAAQLLRDGQAHEAIAVLAGAGHITIADGPIDLYLGMLDSWWTAHRAGDVHPMVDRRHRTRHILNRLARELRHANGELGPDELRCSGDRRFAAGDHVVARAGNRNLHVDGNPSAYLRNGAVGTVTAVHTTPTHQGLDIAFDGIGTIHVPTDFINEHQRPNGRIDVGVDHGYAVTSYAVQGATYDVSTSRIDSSATRAEAYVDITRGRTANRLFLTRAPDPLDGEHLPKAPGAAITQSVGERLRRSGPERAAIDLPVLTISARRSRALTHDTPLVRTVFVALPPTAPIHIRRQRDAALQAALAYRDRQAPPPGPRGERPFGVRESQETAEMRASAIDAVARYTTALSREPLGNTAQAHQQPTEDMHLEYLATFGLEEKQPSRGRARGGREPRDTVRVPTDDTAHTAPVLER